MVLKSLKNPVLWLGFFLLSACQQSVPPGWHEQTIESTPFRLRAMMPDDLKESEVLTVMIEGDGLAWVSRTRPSSDPTPTHPVALSIAQALPNTVYLARPCQYVWSEACSEFFWTEGRFHPLVIQSMQEAIEYLKNSYHAKRLRLMGYSGGGVIAGLLAARLPRGSVEEWVSIASPISWEPWVAYHRVSILRGSLSLEPDVPILLNMPQRHYVGTKDTIVPASVQEVWRTYMRNNPEARWYEVPGLKHGGNWAKVLSALQ